MFDPPVFKPIVVKPELQFSIDETAAALGVTPGEAVDLAWSLYLSVDSTPRLLPLLSRFATLMTRPQDEMEEAIRTSLVKILTTYVDS